MEDVKDKMLFNLRNGLEKGSSTGIKDVDNCWKWRLSEFNIFTGYSNEGKAEKLDNEILTTTGWKTFSSISEGDQVFDELGNPCNVIATSPIFENRPCYEITFSNGSKIVVDENHEWFVDNLLSRNSSNRQKRRDSLLKGRRTGTKADLKKGYDQRSKCLKPFIIDTKSISKNVSNKGMLEYSINLAHPLNLPKKELLIDPYVLGAWLGDGHSDGGGFTSENDIIPNIIKSKGYDINKGAGKYHYSILKFKTILRELNLLQNKHIPEDYLLSSFEDRLELLRGLMDTDGYTDKLGRCEFTTVLPELAKDTYQLLSSLGIDVYLTVSESKLYGVRKKDRHRLRFKTTLQIFNLPRKQERIINSKPPKNNCKLIKSVKYVGLHNTRCIEVDSPNHLYLTGRDFIITHNSLFLKYLCLIKALTDGWKFIISAPEDWPAHEYFDDLLHMMTGQSTDKDSFNQVSEKKYLQALEILKEHFYFVYIKPPDNTIKKVLDIFEPLIHEIGAQVCIIDPLIKFARPQDAPDRDDQYAAYLTTLLTDFARTTNTSTHLVMHQVTPKPMENGLYPKPSMYAVKGGGSYADGTDNILAIQRSNYAKDKLDTSVTFSSQKIKRQRLVGIPQEFHMRFDRKSNRYTHVDGTDLFNFNKYLP